MSRVTVRTPIRRFQNGTFTSRPDTVAGEEPLEIRIGGVPISTTMRTPGHDIELVHGLLHAEGIISGPHDVIAARYCAGVDSAGQNTYNVLDVALTDPAAAAELVRPRAFVTSSACGVCGTSSIEALQKVTRYRLPDLPAVRPGDDQHPAGRAAGQAAGVQDHRRPACRGTVLARMGGSTGFARTSAGTTRWTR